MKLFYYTDFIKINCLFFTYLHTYILIYFTFFSILFRLDLNFIKLYDF